MSDPVSVLAASVHHAVLIGLKPELHEHVRWESGGQRIKTGIMEERRPWIDDVSFVMFEQTWGSTALGFGGVGGQAMTSAYTVVALGPMGDACVYFSGRLAYHILKPGEKFREDMANQRMCQVAGAKSRYETKE